MGNGGGHLQIRAGCGAARITSKSAPEGVPRREKRRFPMDLGVRYRRVKGKRILAVGVGNTVEVSSNQIRFTTQWPLLPGDRVQLAVDWPVKLDNSVLMKLEIYGCVVESESGTATMEIARYDLRTRSQNAGEFIRQAEKNHERRQGMGARASSAG